MTNLESERFHLHFSNERTFLAWIRTATVLMALGYAIARFALYLDERAHETCSMSATYLGGLAMTSAGLIALVIAAGRYQANARGIDRSVSPRANETYVYVFATLVTVTGMLLLILLLAFGE
jgi:putative membrane protein